MAKMQIKRLLVANRGDPVFRAMKTCKRYGIEVVSVFVTEDQSADWVVAADFAFEIPSYLEGSAIIAAAKEAKADAIWPGWGFLAENAEFARAVTDAGLIWVGPNAKAIDALGDKGEATHLAKKGDVPTIPEIAIPGNDLEKAKADIKKLISMSSGSANIELQKPSKEIIDDEVERLADEIIRTKRSILWDED